MAVATLPRIMQFPEGSSPRVTGAMGLSLAAHFIVLVLLAGLRLAPIERPQGSIQVSLVNLPASRAHLNQKPVAVPAERPATSPPAPDAPPPKPVPIPQPVHSVTVPKLPQSPPPIHAVPAPASPSPVNPTAPRATAPRVAPESPPIPSPSPAKREPDRRVTDALKQIELPPAIPELGDLAPPAPMNPVRPANTYKKTDPGAQRLSTKIKDLQIPDTSAPSSSAGKGTTVPEQTKGRPVISEDILEKLRRPVEQLQQLPEHPPADPKEPRVASAKPTPPSSPAPTPSADLTPATSIQAPGAGTSRYWALVQQRINSRWVAPPVDLSQRFFQVVIRFTLDRSGRVIDVSVERSSGNDYYDNAGRRAVLASDPLPPFPAEIKERQLSPLIYFSVGEAAG